jgi:hypothetical protein
MVLYGPPLKPGQHACVTDWAVSASTGSSASQRRAQMPAPLRFSRRIGSCSLRASQAKRRELFEKLPQLHVSEVARSSERHRRLEASSE